MMMSDQGLQTAIKPGTNTEECRLCVCVCPCVCMCVDCKQEAECLLNGNMMDFSEVELQCQ